MHAFPFSERPGTTACGIKPKVPQSISGRRAKEITEWAIKQKISYIESFVGKELILILEPPVKDDCADGIECNDGDEGLYHGMTENFIHCEIEPWEHEMVTGQGEKKVGAVKVAITKVLADRIKKGGDIEAVARIL